MPAPLTASASITSVLAVKEVINPSTYNCTFAIAAALTLNPRPIAEVELLALTINVLTPVLIVILVAELSDE